MDFVTENIVLIVIAFASGAMLLWPMIQRRTGGPALDTLGATRFINDAHPIVLDVREPAEFAAGHLPNARNIPVADLDKRVGDRVAFAVTDGKATIKVNYQGILPDLFREGQGVVTEGILQGDGTFKADTVLAKHDETYMPREVADALKKQGHWKDDYDKKGGAEAKKL